MNSGTQAAKEAGNMVDLDSDPTKLIDHSRTRRVSSSPSPSGRPRSSSTTSGAAAVSSRRVGRPAAADRPGAINAR